MQMARVLGAPRTDILILAGQSNAGGYGSDIRDTSMAHSYPIRFWSDTDYDTSTSFADEVSVRPDYAFGAEMSLAAHLLQNEQYKTRIIKVTRNGSHNPEGTSSLANDVNVEGPSWHPARDELFTLLTDNIDAAFMHVIRPYPKAFIWIQGETDMRVGRSWASDYGFNLNLFFNTLKVRYNVEKYIVIRVKLQDSHPDKGSAEENMVRYGIEQVASNRADTTMIDIDSFYGDVAGPHYRSVEYMALGEWIFNAIYS